MIPLRPKVAFAAALAMSALFAGTVALPPGSVMAAEASRPAAIDLAGISPVARALHDVLEQSADATSAIGTFYAGRNYRPLWLADGGEASPAARALLGWAGQADANALPTGRYNVVGLATTLDHARAGGPRVAASAELALTRLFLTYGSDLTSGLLEPRRINRSMHVKPRRPQPAELLASAAAAPKIDAYLASLVPGDPDYAYLVELYAKLRTIALNGDWGPVVPAGRTLHPGDRSDRLPVLRERLIAIGDLPPEERVASGEVMNDAAAPAGDPLVFDTALEAAVRRFQERHGLNTDGAVGPMTLAAVNTTAAERARQVAVNLERVRWLNYDLGYRHVFINTAAFTMELYEGDKQRFSTRTVVGQAARKYQTPEFVDELEFIVVNPYWNVPSSIAREEILPKLRENPLHLLDNNMELLGSDLPASEIDWTKVTPATFPGRIRQRPGEENALGDVKFLFPNPHSVYMHDTPSRRLFARDRRTFSHGCVRLQDPTEFAHLLLSLQVDDPVETYDRLRARYGEQWVTLENKIPVYVTYRTAWRGRDGSTQFRADVYHRDQDVAAALGETGVSVFAR